MDKKVFLWYGSDVYVLVFFFQAEDGIRDDLVTGVQTCALPISSRLVGRVGLAWAASTTFRSQ